MDEAGMNLLERLGFPREVLDWEVRRLSVGERQRLGLAAPLRSPHRQRPASPLGLRV